MNESHAQRLRRISAGIDALGNVSKHGESSPLDELEDDALRSIALDGLCHSARRVAALTCLVDRHPTDGQCAELLHALFLDGDELVAAAAIARALPYDTRHRESLRILLDDPRQSIWSAAAESLGRRKERSILPRMLEWLRCDDPARRLVGFRTIIWILNPPEQLHFAASAWDMRWARSDDERFMLAELLAALGDDRPLAWLRQRAALDGIEAGRARILLERIEDVSSNL